MKNLRSVLFAIFLVLALVSTPAHAQENLPTWRALIVVTVCGKISLLLAGDIAGLVWRYGPALETVDPALIVKYAREQGAEILEMELRKDCKPT